MILYLVGDNFQRAKNGQKNEKIHFCVKN
jgi:hypothetical protein